MLLGRNIIRKEATGDSFSAGVYGSIIATALVGALHEEHASPGKVALSLVSSMAVFFLAHTWSEITGERIYLGTRFSWRHAWEIALSEWPLVEATFGPLVPLLVGAAGGASAQTASTIALAVCVLQCLGWGLAVGARAYDRWWQIALSAATTSVLALAVVGLEVLVLH